MSEVDDWAPVQQQKAADDDWQPVKATTPESGPSFSDRFDAVNPPAPESFLHRIALGMMIGEHGQSPAELRAKGFEDFDVATNTVDHFKAGLDRLKKGFTESHSAYEVGVGAFDALMSPLSAAFQAVGGAGEKATGGILTGDQINTALMVSDGAAGRISRVRNGAEQVIGAMPKAEDFSQAAKVLAPEAKATTGLRLVEAPEGGVYEPGQIKPNEKYFKAVDQNGNVAAEMLVGIDGKTARVEDILRPGLPREEGRNTIGGSDVRSILRQFQEAHPEIEEITGKRVSGARMGGGYSLIDEAEQVRVNLQRMWQEDGIHPAEAVHDAEADAFLKNEITAYHGSPHDFERFDLSNALTGEGNRTYGHGIYFAENRGTAESYATMQSAGDVADDAYNLIQNLGSREAAISHTEKQVAKFGSSYQELLDRLKDPSFEPKKAGNLYQVQINADRSKMLDWDKPVVDQPRLENALRQRGIPITEGMMGQDAYWAVVDRAGGHPEASRALTEAGVPGIKYLDQESRGVGEGTRNYVVFSDKDVQITHKNDVMVAGYPMPRDDFDALAETGGAQSLSAMRTPPEDMPPLVSPQIQPAQPPGRLAAAFKDAGDKLLDIGRDAQMLVAPMATGTRDSMAIAKDFANSIRKNRWDWARMDKDIADRFSPEARARMWTAADEESVSLQLEEPAHMREHQGLATLEPAERAVVEEMHARAQNAWVRAQDVGMVEGEGLPAYTPRMIINTMGAGGKEKALPLNSIGSNLKTKTANLLKRQYLESQETEAAAKAKYGDQAMLARDIRVLPLATSQLEDAIAGRILINNIKDYGKQTGAETVVEGAIPVGSDTKWFTLDHPAFRTWRPKFETVDGKVQAMTDSDGNAVFEQVPLYVHGDFEGPLRAVLSQKSGALYGGMMAIKGKTMSLIMNSPMIHNAVEWGRAVPALPGKVATFKVYFEGNRAKNDVALMHEAIDSGLVPIGHRFFNQDITSIMESPDLTPGRSWTAKVLGFVPGLFDEGAGNAVKGAIDKAGDFWHNTLLWDRVADLQMGLYTNFRADAMAKGIDQQTASRMAAHWANRYAGALPKEAMSDGATKVANMLLFSRSFTMGNLGVLKDVFTGLPKDVIAQIERDAGFKTGAINEAGELAGPEVDAVKYAKSMARRKAMSVVALDVALMYVGNSILQNTMNVLFNDSTLEKEYHGYAARFLNKLQAVKEHPLELLQPLKLMEDLSATSENEPGRKDRVRIGSAADGTSIYARNPVGKIGDEFIGWMTGPLDMMRKKMGTIARPAWQVMNNDAGFGRKVYDPGADTPAKYLTNIGKIAAHIAGSQLPEGQMHAAADLVKGEGDAKVNALQALGPFAGVTFSKGAPGGPAVGEMYAARSQHEFQVNQALPDIRKQILRGDVAGATERMKELGIPAGLQRFYVRTTLNPATRMSPRAVQDFYRYATPEQRDRFERARQPP